MVDLERDYLLSVCPGRWVGMWDEEGERRLGQGWWWWWWGSSWEEGMESGHPGAT